MRPGRITLHFVDPPPRPAIDPFHIVAREGDRRALCGATDLTGCKVVASFMVVRDWDLPVCPTCAAIKDAA